MCVCVYWLAALKCQRRHRCNITPCARTCTHLYTYMHACTSYAHARAHPLTLSLSLSLARSLASVPPREGQTEKAMSYAQHTLSHLLCVCPTCGTSRQESLHARKDLFCLVDTLASDLAQWHLFQIDVRLVHTSVRSGKTSSIINKQNPNDKAPQIIGNIAPGGTAQQTRREKRVCAKKRGVSHLLTFKG